MTVRPTPLPAPGDDERSTVPPALKLLSLQTSSKPSRTHQAAMGSVLQRLRREVSGLSRALRPRLLVWAGCARLLPDFAFPALRTQLYRWAGCRIAPRVAILGSLRLIGPGPIAKRLSVEHGALIAPGVTFGLDAAIDLGPNVSVSPGVTFCTATHPVGFGSERMSRVVIRKPIVVEGGVWIGMNSLILPGVTLGRGSVVAAGSVVSQNVAADTLVAGNPATVLQTLPFANR